MYWKEMLMKKVKICNINSEASSDRLGSKNLKNVKALVVDASTPQRTMGHLFQVFHETRFQQLNNTQLQSSAIWLHKPELTH